MARRDLAIVTLLLVLMLAPFAGKAFHIDDAFFLAVARNILAHPWRPFDGAVALDNADYLVFARSVTTPNTFATLSHPPLVPYVMAAVSVMSGGFREIPQHAAFSFFALLAAWAQYRLAVRFTRAPLLATLALLVSPTFLLSAQSLMTDVPALAFMLAALSFFVTGVDSGRTRDLVLAGLLGGLAFLTRYVALGLIPLAVAYVLLRPGRTAKAWWALVPAGLILVGWCGQNWSEHGAIHLVASLRHYFNYYDRGHVEGVRLARIALFDLSAMGGTAVPTLALLAGGAPLSRRLGLGAAALVLAGAVPLLEPFGLVELSAYTSGQAIGLVVCVGLGLFLVAESIVRAMRGSADTRFLVLWFVAALIGAIVLLPFGASRYLLPALSPLALVAASVSATPRWIAASWAAIVACAGLSLVMAVADFEFAETYRDIAARVSAEAAGHRVWFIGDWGFRHYMEEAGGHYLRSTDESPGADDWIVRPHVAGMHDLSPALQERVSLTRTMEVPGVAPIRLMSFAAKAGFYSHGWGYLPAWLPREPLETFDVFRVVTPPPR